MLTFAVSIPFGGRYVPPEMMLAMPNLQFPMGTSRAWVSTKKVKRDIARNMLAHEALRMGAKYLFFIDDDTMPPPDALVKLYQELECADDATISCGGIYTSKKENTEPLVFAAPQSGPYWKWKVGDVFPCWGIATGCLLIKTDVFKALPEPWFRDIESRDEIHDDPAIRKLDPDEEFRMTDDLYFATKVAAAGFKQSAHGGVLPLHWDQKGRPYFLSPDSPPMRGVDQKSLWYNRFGTIRVRNGESTSTSD